MRIGVLGGTGPAGRALASRLASVDFDVVIGSRTAERAVAAVNKVHERWPDRSLPLTGDTNEGAAAADLVIVATPWEAAAETALSVRHHLDGKVVACMANALARVGFEFQSVVPPRGSVAANVQGAVPEALVAAAFHHLPAGAVGRLDDEVDSDVLVCSDHREAVEAVCQVARRIPGVRPVHVGSLSNAAPLETFVSVLLEVNARYDARVAIRLTGLDVEADHFVPTLR